MHTSSRNRVGFGLGIPLLLAALFFQTVTLASQEYTGTLVYALVLIVAADVCFIQAFKHGGLVARVVSALLILPTLFVVFDFIRRAPHSTGFLPYSFIAAHFAILFLAKYVWRRRGRTWTTSDTAACIAMPVAAVLIWDMAFALMITLVPDDSWLDGKLEQIAHLPLVGIFISIIFPVMIFWICFFRWGLKIRDPLPTSQGSN